MFYREMQDNENININDENDGMPNSHQMPNENQQIGTQEMPLGQSCPYMNQGMCPNMMYQQPMNYNYPQQNQSNFSNDSTPRDIDGSRQFGWGAYPYDGYPFGSYPYGYDGYPYGSYPYAYDGYPYGGNYGHGWYDHHGGHGHR